MADAKYSAAVLLVVVGAYAAVALPVWVVTGEQPFVLFLILGLVGTVVAGAKAWNRWADDD